MKLAAHLTFDGRCEEAFNFYAKTLQGKLAGMLTFGESPLAEEVSPAWRGKIVHATLTVGDAILAGADALAGQYQAPQGFYVLLSIEDPSKAEAVFHALAENGEIRMPIQKTFWSPAFGVLVDQFGIPWEISCAQSPGVT